VVIERVNGLLYKMHCEKQPFRGNLNIFVKTLVLETASLAFCNF